MKKTAWIVFCYAFLVSTGGVIGYLKSASLPSLLSGGIFGSLLFLSSYFMFKKKVYGYFGALFLSVGLEAFFTWRFAKTLKFFPAGMLGLISLAVIIIVACKIGRRLRTVR